MQAKQNIQKGQKKKRSKKQILFATGESLASHTGVFRGARALP